MLALTSQAVGFTGAAVRAPAMQVKMSAAEEELKKLAQDLNPVVGYWDPLNLAGRLEIDGWLFAGKEGSSISGTGTDGAIGFLRHAEIKHGRVAMAAFIGYIVHENGIRWPTAMTGTDWWSFSQGPADYSMYEGLSAPDVWDALSGIQKLQIVAFVGILELWSESSDALAADGQKHYMRGGKPGHFPAWDNIKGPRGNKALPLTLWDPFGFTSKMTPERKEQARLAEINNGRLAQIGIFGLISSSKGLIVPGIDSVGLKPYAGEVMQPFGENIDWSSVGY